MRRALGAMRRARRPLRRLWPLGRLACATAAVFASATVLALLVPGASAETARQVFGGARVPSAQAPAPIGSYAKGCLAGGIALAETAPGWQAMRLSRNRNWGHPEMIAFIERLSTDAQVIGWPRIYVGDISQPRGGPMLTGHRSHQIGLDADIWMRRPGEEVLSRSAR
ncbi:MAG: penicillin-insensitive murein endopeptidase, partial [Pseudomonadota bacterium]